MKGFKKSKNDVDGDSMVVAAGETGIPQQTRSTFALLEAASNSVPPRRLEPRSKNKMKALTEQDDGASHSNGDDDEDDDDEQFVPPVDLRHHQEEFFRPGAVPIAGPGLQDEPLSDEESLSSFSSPTTTGEEEMAMIGLQNPPHETIIKAISARLVDEDEERQKYLNNLVVAETLEEKPPGFWMSKRHLYLGLSLFLLLLAAGLGLGLGLSDRVAAKDALGIPSPTSAPTTTPPTQSPSWSPSAVPSLQPTLVPSLNPTITAGPTENPTFPDLFAPLGDHIQFGGTPDGRIVTTALSDNGKVLAVGFDSVVRVYEYQNESSWVQLGSSLEGLLNVPKWFGGPQVSVALAGNALVLAIGDPMRHNETGLVQVYEYNSTLTDWTLRGEALFGDPPTAVEKKGRRFGYDVALSSDGETLAVLASNGETFYGQEGYCTLYRYDDSDNYGLHYRINATIDEEGADLSMALSGNGHRVVIGMPSWSWDYPATIRAWDCSDDTQYGFETCNLIADDIRGSDSIDVAGTGISLNDKGDILAVGAPGVSECISTLCGSVRIFKTNFGLWNQYGQAQFGPLGFGAVVRLSADGNRLTVGTYDTAYGRILSLAASTQVYDFAPEELAWKKAGSAIEAWFLDMSDDGSTVVVRGANSTTRVVRHGPTPAISD